MKKIITIICLVGLMNIGLLRAETEETKIPQWHKTAGVVFFVAAGILGGGAVVNDAYGKNTAGQIFGWAMIFGSLTMLHHIYIEDKKKEIGLRFDF